MVSAIRIVSIPLYLLRWNEYVLPVLSPLCEDVSIDVLDFCWITIRVVAAANRRAVRHPPG